MAQEINIGGQALSDLENLLNDVVSSLAKYEGTKGGEAVEFKGQTNPFGIDNPPFPQEESESVENYVKRIAKHFHNGLINNFGESYTSAPDSVKKALIDFQYNTGGFAGTKETPSLNNALKNKDYTTAMRNTLDVISAKDPDKNNQEGVLKGLATRRAIEYNKAADDLNIPKINFAKLEKTPEGNARIIYKDKSDNVVLDYTFKTKGIHTKSNIGSFSPIEEQLKY
jgi:GH24 family phage-related lysozyme (muramidase)